MGENTQESKQRRETLKGLIRKLHAGHGAEDVREELVRVLGSIPYDDVVHAEQELIAEGLPREEVIKLCDVHTAALKGAIDQSGARIAPEGHPVHTFKLENNALNGELLGLEKLMEKAAGLLQGDTTTLVLEMRDRMNRLMDVDKHYRRKEYLLFPYLEKHGITAPPTVMWAKHDETRVFLKEALSALNGVGGDIVRLHRALPVLKKASDAVQDMTGKEDQILFPMSLDTLTDPEWYDIAQQSRDIGFCLVDPKESWIPANLGEATTAKESGGRFNLPTGSLSAIEVAAILDALPADVTFVDKDDTVRYFSQGKDRIFERNRAVLGRKVQHCHPPKSVHMVEKILSDFRDGKESSAAFWITMKERFIHIEYVALRDTSGGYLGTLEFTQDLTDKKSLTGEQRLLSYSEKQR
ncbi:MAG: DUF438 domain-containing protein [Spirochaetes bacterium]|nr:MAG: DUF438 domain-containing protein [Spirochaetota bacterium]